MRPLRPATREIVERLQPDGAGLWSRVRLRCDGSTLIIDEIGLSGRQAAIIHLLPHLLGEPPAAHAAAQAVATILRWKGVRALAQLENLRHRLRKWNPDSRWQDLSLKDVPRLGMLPHGWAALGLASWHPNGYIREAAVQALARRTEAGKHELPFLLLRCNDQVAAVRAAAREYFVARIHPRYADALVRALPLLLPLRQQRRADADMLVDSVLKLLQSPAGCPALARGTASTDSQVRRESFRLVLDANSGAPDVEFLKRALGELDVNIRWAAAHRLSWLSGQAAPATTAAATFCGLLEHALRDPAVRVRMEVLPLASTQPEGWRRQTFDMLLCDQHAPIRAIAHAELARITPGFDAAARYRELLTSLANARQIQGALLGLAERGVEDDVLLILPWLTDPRARLRAAALQATAMLDPTSIEPFIDALCDPSKRISRAAAKVIARRPRHDLVARLSAIAESATVAPHVRAHALDLICAASPWTRLLALLRITASACQDAAEQAAQRIRPHTSQRPTADELRAVDEALAAASLPIATRCEIVDSLRFWHE